MSLLLVTAVADSRLLSGKLLPELIGSTHKLTIIRGINEGRSAARDVDVFLMGVGTQLPKTGGIVQRAPYEIVGHPERMRQQAVPAT